MEKGDRFFGGRNHIALSSADLVVLALSAFFIVLQRFHAYAEPLERDITCYALMGQGLLDGRLLYTDLWDNKPPLAYLLHAFVQVIWGFGPSSIFALNILGSLALLAGIFVSTRIWAGSSAARAAALVWVLIGADLGIQANQPNLELLMNVGMIWAFALTLRWFQTSNTVFLFIAAGLMTASTLIKPLSVVSALVWMTVILWNAWRQGGLDAVSRAAAWWIGIPAVTWGILWGYFFLMGRANDFISAVFGFNLAMAGDFWTNLIHLLTEWPPEARFLILPLFVGLAWVCFDKSPDPWPKRLWGAYLVAALLEITIPSYLVMHYFQLCLVPLVMGMGAAWNLPERWNARTRRWLHYIWLLGALGLTWHSLPAWRMTPEACSNYKYGPQFIYTRKLAYELREILEPGETFYQLGNESGLYFYSGKRPPTGMLSAYALYGLRGEQDLSNPSPLEGVLTEREIRDLDRTRPEICVVLDRYWGDSEKVGTLPKWISEHYLPILAWPSRKPFLLFARKGGRLDQKGWLGRAGVRNAR